MTQQPNDTPKTASADSSSFDPLKEYQITMELAKKQLAQGDAEAARKSEQRALAISSGGELPSKKIESIKNGEGFLRRGYAYSDYGNPIAAIKTDSSNDKDPGHRDITLYVNRPDSKLSIQQDKPGDGEKQVLRFHNTKTLEYGVPQPEYTFDAQGREGPEKFTGRFKDGKAIRLTSAHATGSEPSQVIQLNSKASTLNIISTSGLQLDLTGALDMESVMGRRITVSQGSKVTWGPQTHDCKVTVSSGKEDGHCKYPTMGPTVIRVHQSMLSERLLTDKDGKPLRNRSVSGTYFSSTDKTSNSIGIPSPGQQHSDGVMKFPKDIHVIMEIYNDEGKTVGTLPISKDGKTSGSDKDINTKMQALGEILNKGPRTIKLAEPEPDGAKPPSIPSNNLGNSR